MTVSPPARDDHPDALRHYAPRQPAHALQVTGGDLSPCPTEEMECRQVDGFVHLF